MKKVDQLIREALSDEEARLIDEMEAEQSILQDFIDLYRGRYRWILALWTVATIGLLIIVVYGVIHFFQATEIRSMIIWGGVAYFSMTAILGIKIWSWMEINKNSLMREIKRLELQIAYLAGKIGKQGDQK